MIEPRPLPSQGKKLDFGSREKVILSVLAMVIQVLRQNLHIKSKVGNVGGVRSPATGRPLLLKAFPPKIMLPLSIIPKQTHSHTAMLLLCCQARSSVSFSLIMVAAVKNGGSRQATQARQTACCDQAKNRATSFPGH